VAVRDVPTGRQLPIGPLHPHPGAIEGAARRDAGDREERRVAEGEGASSPFSHYMPTLINGSSLMQTQSERSWRRET